VALPFLIDATSAGREAHRSVAIYEFLCILRWAPWALSVTIAMICAHDPENLAPKNSAKQPPAGVEAL